MQDRACRWKACGMQSACLVDNVEVEVHVLRLVGDLERRAVPYAAAGQRRQCRRQVRRVFCDLMGRTSVRATVLGGQSSTGTWKV